MSLEVDGVWKAGVWATTVWADGVWREGEAQVRVINVGAGVDAPSWQEAVQRKFDELHSKLEAEVKQEKKIARQIVAAKKKAAKAEKPEGILANLHLLEHKRREIRQEIKELKLQIEWVNIEKALETEEEEELLLLH